jgi:hypothetical protein
MIFTSIETNGTQNREFPKNLGVDVLALKPNCSLEI